MLPDRVSNPGPLTYESGALRIALRGPALNTCELINKILFKPSTKSMYSLALLYSERPKLYTILAFLGATGLILNV